MFLLADVTVEKSATNAWKRRLSEAYVTVGRARPFREALGISSWQSMLRHSSLPKAPLGASIRRIIRGLQRGTFARFAESILLHAQNARQAPSSSRSALSTTLARSKALNWLPGLLRCRSFICCRLMCPHTQKFRGLQHEGKMPNTLPGHPAAVAIHVSRGSSRYLFIFIIFAASLFAGCAPSRNDLVGTYSGALNGATERLVLRLDGTFSQDLTLPSGQKTNSSGAWSLKYKAVTLDRYLKFYSEEKNGALIEPRPGCGLIYQYGDGMLIRDWESGYYTLRKQ